MTTAIAERRESPARRRILDTAAALFYAEGVHTVGVDRIIAEAGVAKATFYHHFRAKDDLVCAYLAEQHRQQRDVADAIRAASTTPREVMLRIFDYMARVGAGPGYRGCPFINVAAEYPDPGKPVRRAVAEHRDWVHDLLRGLLTGAGDPDPERTAALLMLIRDGLIVGSCLDDPETVRGLTRDAVTRVLDGPRST